MTHMNTFSLSLSKARLLVAILLLTLGFQTPLLAQQFHGGAILKTPLGPNGTSQARVGDTITATITVINLDEFGDSLRLTSIVDRVFHASGTVTSPNLLPGGMPVTLASFLDMIIVTHTYTVMPGDNSFPDQLLKDDAICGGTDLRNGPNGGTPDDFLLTFPGQVFIERDNPNTNICVIEAVSDRFNPRGTDHAVWMPGISTNLIFTPEPGSFVEFPDGTASFTGTVRSRTNLTSGFKVNVMLSGRTAIPGPDSPKLDLHPDAYIQNGGPVDPATWYYYEDFSGTLMGFGLYEGALLEIIRFGPAWQIGVGANGKNDNFGASAWFTWSVIQQPFNTSFPVAGQGDFNIDIFVCEPSTVGDFVWFDANGNGVQDGGAEIGVQGVEVRLANCNNVTLLTTATDAGGRYQFTNLLAGSYKVRVVLPGNTAFTLRDSGGNDALDSDVLTNGFTACFALPLVATNNTIDAGIVAAVGPAPSPRILAIQTLPAGAIRLTLQGTRFRYYVVEGSETFGEWKSIATVLNVNGVIQFQDSAQPASCFYRLRLVP